MPAPTSPAEVLVRICPAAMPEGGDRDDQRQAGRGVEGERAPVGDDRQVAAGEHEGRQPSHDEEQDEEEERASRAQRRRR